MRVDPDTCRDPDLLAAEVRRLLAVAEQPCPYVTGTVTRYCTLTPFTLTDAERDAVAWALRCAPQSDCNQPRRDTLRGLLERTSDRRA